MWTSLVWMSRALFVYMKLHMSNLENSSARLSPQCPCIPHFLPVEGNSALHGISRSQIWFCPTFQQVSLCFYHMRAFCQCSFGLLFLLSYVQSHWWHQVPLGWGTGSSDTRYKCPQSWSSPCLWLHRCNSHRADREGIADCCLCAYLCSQLLCTALWAPARDVGISSSSSHLPGTLSSWKLPSPSWYPQKVIVLNNSLGWQSWQNKRMVECYYLTLYAALDMTFSFFCQSSSMLLPSISPWRFISVTSWNHFKENGFSLPLDLYIKHRHQEGVPGLGWTYRICCFRWSLWLLGSESHVDSLFGVSGQENLQKFHDPELFWYFSGHA